jgi:hypothetical protein
MMRQHGTRRVAKRKPEMSLRFEIAPGVASAHDSHAVIILEPINGSEVRVRDLATWAEQSVPVSELSGIPLGLSRADIQHRWASGGAITGEAPNAFTGFAQRREFSSGHP